MRLTAAQAAAYASGAGFPSGEVANAVAVAIAENRGTWDGTSFEAADLGDVALETSKWGPSVGVWQIRSLKPAALAKTHGADTYRDASKLTDPAYNAKAAHAIWAEAGGWHPWSTYPGVYLLYLPQGNRAAKAPALTAGSTAGAEPVAFTGTAQPVSLVGDLAGAGLAGLSIPLGLLNPANMLGAAKQGLGLFAALFSLLAKAGVWISDSHNWFRIAEVWLGTWMSVVGLVMFGWPAINMAANFVPAGKVAKAAGTAARAGKASKAAGAAKTAATPKAAAAPKPKPAPAAAAKGL